MLFRNLTLFRLDQGFADALNAELLHTRLADHPARSCGSLELEAAGFAPPLGREGMELVHSSNGCLLVALQTDQKLLPPAVIGQELEERVAMMEQSEDRSIGRRERNRLKEQIIDELLPRAFSKRRACFGLFDPRNRRLAVDSATPREVERLTGQLRHALGTLPIVPATTAESPAGILTGWLASPEKLPSDFSFDGDCELENEGIVRCRHQDLTGAEIRAHLDAGKRVRKLGLVWEDRISFLLDEHFVFRRIKFHEFIDEELERMDLDDAAALFDAEFTIMAGELQRLLGRLTELFGGEA